MNYTIEQENKEYVMVKASPQTEQDTRVLAMFSDGETKLDNAELKSVLSMAGSIVSAKGFKVIQVDVPNDSIFPVKIQPKYY
jgi:hypothetical protein